MLEYLCLGYNVKVIENEKDALDVAYACPDTIGLYAFDTETNTKIDMSKRDASNIDIMHDLPFLLQFGYGNTVYVFDFRISPEIQNLAKKCFVQYCNKAKLVLGANVKFDIHMMYNIGTEYDFHNACDIQTIARLALESKSEREGGYSLALKPLASRILGTEYSQAGREIDEALKSIWNTHLKKLEALLKPYKRCDRQS